jgi:hypothetical protein
MHFAYCISGTGPARRRREAVIRFLNRTWFRRAWVYQEAVVAADVEVYWGSFCVPFDILARLVLSTYYLTKIEKYGIWSRKFKKSQGFGPLRAMWYDREQYHRREPLNFLHVLWRARKYLEASKREDMVYSFLAFDDLSEDYKVKADYGISSHETFTNLACSMMKSRKSLDILQCIVPTKASKSVVAPNDLPSWVPDWSNRKFSGAAPILNPGMPHYFDACHGSMHEWIQGDTKVSNILYVKGHVIDSIYTVIAHEWEENTYFKASLRQVLKLDGFIKLLSDELKLAAEELDRAVLDQTDATPGCTPMRASRVYLRRKYDDIPATALWTLLADGSFGLVLPINHSIYELLRIYKTDSNQLFDPKNADDAANRFGKKVP